MFPPYLMALKKTIFRRCDEIGWLLKVQYDLSIKKDNLEKLQFFLILQITKCLSDLEALLGSKNASIIGRFGLVPEEYSVKKITISV